MKNNQLQRNRLIQIVTFIMLTGIFLPLILLAGERFVNNGDGTVTDSETGLMWSAKDNGVNIDFRAANASAEKSSLAGYTDWRLPDRKELVKIYDPTRKNDQGFGITDKIKLSECCQWSSYDSTGVSSLIDFSNGKELWMYKNDSEQLRFLLVRDAK